MKVRRDIVNLKKLAPQDDSFVKAPPGELLSFMWELTAEIWFLKGADYVERRLQRNVTNLIKQKQHKRDADYLMRSTNS
jgi:hypothetical protein